MKHLFLVSLALLSLGFYQCSREKEDSSQLFAKVNYDEASIQLMEQLTPQIEGTWSFRAVHIRYEDYNYALTQIPLTKDTTFQDLAIMNVRSVAVSRSSPRDARRAEFEGTIEFRGKSYPIYFNLLANSDWIYNKQGPHAFFLFEYNFPSGSSHPTEPEEAFLSNIGLIGANFSLETTAGHPTMIWEGVNRAGTVEKIQLRKR